MICDNLTSWKKHGINLTSSLKKGLIWVEENFSSPPMPGKHPLEAGSFVLVQKYSPKEWMGIEFENHRKFIDIQVIVEGNESILWAKSQYLKESKPYVEKNDVEFFSVDPAKEYSNLMMSPGFFAIFWPTDSHVPGLQPSGSPPANQNFTSVLKFVVKVPVE